MTPEDLLAALDNTQHQAVTHGDGPLLVVAGPGSGKTRVLTHRVAELLRRGTPPWQIMAVTFTNKAAAEMRERLTDLVGQETASKLWVCTFHSACVRVLRMEHEAAGLPKGFSIADTGDSYRMIRNIMKSMNMGGDDLKKAVGAARSAISWARNRGISEDQVSSVSGIPKINEIAGAYRKALHSAGAVDFDDLILRTRHIFKADPGVSERWASKFVHVLVDEFQDTNPIQMDLIRHLTSGHRNLTAVGDIDQSVYAFRAADPEGMVRFSEEWSDASVVILDRNYRSTAAIVEVNSSIIAGNEAIHRAHQTAAGNPGEPVVLRTCADDREEASYVVSMVKSLGGRYSDHAVLVRTNAQTRVLEEAFNRSNIPARLIGAIPFYQRAEVRDAVAWLRAAVNRKDRMAFERASSAPRRGMGDQVLARLWAETPDGGDIQETALELAAQGVRSANVYSKFVTDLRSVADVARAQGPSSAISHIYTLGMRTQWSKAQGGEGRLENLDELVRMTSEFCTKGEDAEGQKVAEMSPAFQTLTFLEHVALVSNPNDDKTENSVSIMTVHAAKGREFPNVYVVGLEEKLFPHSRSLDEAGGVQEERRLLFVATSRAQQRLFLSKASQRFMYGRIKESTPSRFIEELPPSVIKSGSEAPERKSHGSGMGTWQGGSSHSSKFSGSKGTKKSTSPKDSNLIVNGLDREERRAHRKAQLAAKRSAATQQREPQKPPESETIKPNEAHVGNVVSHKIFGEGVIKSVNGDIAEIKFKGVKKTMDLTFAPMKKR